MLDLKFILKNIDLVKKNCIDRNMNVNLDDLEKLASERSSLISELEEIRMNQNQTAKAMKAKLSDEERKELIKKGSELKAKATELDEKTKEIDSKVKEIQAKIPNMSHPDTPVGKGEESNKIICFYSEPTKFESFLLFAR